MEEAVTKKVLILRGLPGAGKSRYIRTLPPQRIVVSADKYFMREGTYRFDRAQLRKAHDKCLLDFLATLQHGLSLIVVDNTNIRAWEIAPYWALATAFGYEVTIVHIRARIEDCLLRNTHEVPAHQIGAMSEAMRQPLPPHWKVEEVTDDVKLTELWAEASSTEKVYGVWVRAKHDPSRDREYDNEARARRAAHDGMVGRIVKHHDSHGLCFMVRVEELINFAVPWDPEELEVVRVP